MSAQQLPDSEGTAGTTTAPEESVSLVLDSLNLKLRSARAELVDLWRLAVAHQDTELIDQLVVAGHAVGVAVAALSHETFVACSTSMSEVATH